MAGTQDEKQLAEERRAKALRAKDNFQRMIGHTEELIDEAFYRRDPKPLNKLASLLSPKIKEKDKQPSERVKELKNGFKTLSENITKILFEENSATEAFALIEKTAKVYAALKELLSDKNNEKFFLNIYGKNGLDSIRHTIIELPSDLIETQLKKLSKEFQEVTEKQPFTETDMKKFESIILTLSYLKSINPEHPALVEMIKKTMPGIISDIKIPQKKKSNHLGVESPLDLDRPDDIQELFKQKTELSGLSEQFSAFQKMCSGFLDMPEIVKSVIEPLQRKVTGTDLTVIEERWVNLKNSLKKQASLNYSEINTSTLKLLQKRKEDLKGIQRKLENVRAGLKDSTSAEHAFRKDIDEIQSKLEDTIIKYSTKIDNPDILIFEMSGLVESNKPIHISAERLRSTEEIIKDPPNSKKFNKDDVEKIKNLEKLYKEFSKNIETIKNDPENSIDKNLITDTMKQYNSINDLLLDNKVISIYGSEIENIKKNVDNIYNSGDLMGKELQRVSKSFKEATSKPTLDKADIALFTQIFSRLAYLKTIEPNHPSLKITIETTIPQILIDAIPIKLKSATDRLNEIMPLDLNNPNGIKDYFELVQQFSKHSDNISALREICSKNNLREIAELLKSVNHYSIDGPKRNMIASWTSLLTSLNQKWNQTDSLKTLNVLTLQKTQQELWQVQNQLKVLKGLSSIGNETKREIRDLLDLLIKHDDEISKEISNKKIESLFNHHSSKNGQSTIQDLYLKSAPNIKQKTPLQGQLAARQDEINFVQILVNELNKESSIEARDKAEILRSAIAYFESNLKRSETSIGIDRFQAMLQTLNKALPPSTKTLDNDARLGNFIKDHQTAFRGNQTAEKIWPELKSPSVLTQFKNRMKKKKNSPQTPSLSPGLHPKNPHK